MRANVERNKVWFLLLGILCVVLFVLLVQTALADTKKQPGKEAVQTDAPKEGLKTNAYPKVNALIEKYFSASTHGNTETLKQIIRPFTESDETSASRKSEFVESYENVTCYTEDGVDQGSYIAFVTYELKFPDVDTLVPGLETMVLLSDEEGNVYINKDDSLISEAMNAQIQELLQREDVIELISETNAKFAAAIQADANVKSLVEQMGKDPDSIVGDNSSEDTKATQTPVEPEGTPAPLGDVKKEMAVIVDLQVYKNPQEGEAISSVKTGSFLWVDKNVEGGFSYVDIEGLTGYVKTAGLAFYKPVDEEITATVNYYASCSSGTAALGTINSDKPYYCTLEYSNGWRQILVNGTKVYVKKSDLGLSESAPTPSPTKEPSATKQPDSTKQPKSTEEA